MPESSDQAHPLARPLAVGRLAIGVLALVAPSLAARWFGVPAEQDNGAARLMTRLFGVRDVALGLLTLIYADDARFSARVHRALAGVDAGDASAALVALARREGIDRAAAATLAVASGASATGLVIASSESERAAREEAEAGA